MHALIVTFNPSCLSGEDLLKVLASKLGLKHVRSEAFLCHFADRHIQRLVGRFKRRQVLLEQDLRVNGVPADYQAHIAIRGEEFFEERAILNQLEKKLGILGYRCQLFFSDESGRLKLVSEPT